MEASLVGGLALPRTSSNRSVVFLNIAKDASNNNKSESCAHLKRVNITGRFTFPGKEMACSRGEVGVAAAVAAKNGIKSEGEV